MKTSSFSKAVNLTLTGLATLTLVSFGSTHQAQAWGKRGHSIVCETAAYLAAREPKGEFLKAHSFDLGYYCNVPDLVWKGPETYKAEWTNHFMDMEIFEREMKDSKVEKPFELDRNAFNAAFPNIKDEAGRSWWRIRELSAKLDGLGESLKRTDLKREERHALQAEWLTTAGATGHYIGDLSQPLHVTENYNGQMTDQKGIHSFFEEEMVDELFLSGAGSLEGDVMRTALAQWKKYKQQTEKQSLLEFLQKLAKDSNKDLAALLKTDKKVGRKDIKKAAAAYRPMIVKTLAAGALAQAEYYRRHLGWDYDGEKFYDFITAPKFIEPGPPQPVPPSASIPPTSQPASKP